MITLARRLTILVALGWAGYVTVTGAWTYYATQDAIDRALADAAAVYRTPLRTGAFTLSMLDDVRDRIAQDAGRGDFPVRGASISVSATEQGFLAVPVSLQRSLADVVRS